jgi:Glycosyl transferase 4-like domain
VSYWVPPRTGIGSIRASHLLKHLPENGWDVTALTARLANAHDAQYVETGYWDIKGAVKRLAGIGDRGTHEALKLDVPAYGAKRTMMQRCISAAAGIVTYPDEHAGWLPFASAAIAKLLRSDSFDAILSSGPPFVAHIAAALSHGKVPWIADLRDLWAEDDSREPSVMESLFDDKLERWCLSRASALTISSTLSALRFQRRYPGKACYAISTGFDEDEWERIAFQHDTQCTLIYAGTLYRGKRDPNVVFAAVREILDERLADDSELRIDFFTEREPWLLQEIARFRLEGVVRVRGVVERTAVLAAERCADRLLLLSWDGPTAEGIVPGKLFEYFGARRPILAVGGPASSSVEQLLQETQTGVRVRTKEQTKAEIMRALEEHRSARCRELDYANVAAYTARGCAREFAAVLNYAAGFSDPGALSARNSATIATPANTAK